jgi:hypothetical protein
MLGVVMDPHVHRVRKLAAAVEGSLDQSSEAAVNLLIGDKQYAWTLLEWPGPKKTRTPVPEVLAVVCTHDRKAFLIEAAPDRYFSTPHYDGYPGVLVCLDAVDDAELVDRLREAADRRR